MLVANVIALTLLLVFGIVLLAKKKRNLVDLFLLLIIFFFAAYLASDIWVNYDLNRWSFAFHSMTSYSMFLPFFFYAMMLISRNHQIKKEWWWFFSFHFVYWLFIILDVFVLNDYSSSDITGLYLDPPWYYHFFYKGLHVYIIATMIWFIRRHSRYQRKIEDYYSNLEEVKLDWLKYFAWIYTIVYSISLVSFLSFNFGLIKDIKIPYLFISLLMVGSLIWLIYKGIRQYSLANFAEAVPNEKEADSKYQSSSLSHEQMDYLFTGIKKLFEEDNIYHDPELKVQDIAERLGVTNHNVSQTINLKAEKTFYEFANAYRIAYFKEQLADPEKRKFTILALGLESGFNSKASLNRIFKQQLGITPREYQQSLAVAS